MTDQSNDTKSKIIETARVLFAEHGFEGASIRDIARAAEVNVASVNYHFSSKEKLFMEILQTAYIQCAAEMKILLEKNNYKIDDTLVDYFRYFLSRSHDLISHFKLMMSSQHSHKTSSENTEDAMYGPPGGMVLADAIRKHVPGVNEENLHWGLKTLYSHVSHITIIHTCCLKKENEIPFSSQDDLEKGIRRLTKLVLNELKTTSQV